MGGSHGARPSKQSISKREAPPFRQGKIARKCELAGKVIGNSEGNQAFQPTKANRCYQNASSGKKGN